MNVQSPTDIAGEYYLEDLPELASGFKIDPAQGFRFFVTYGALDRYGAGKWAVHENVVSFQSSNQWPGKDFAMVGSTTTNDNFITIRITDKNQNILRFAAASIKKGERGSWQPADAKGYIHFPKQQVEVIALLSEFSAERFSVFNVSNAAHNYFEFRFEPWIMEFFFNDFRLTIEKKGLRGKHPMLQGDGYFYKKRSR